MPIFLTQLTQLVYNNLFLKKEKAMRHPLALTPLFLTEMWERFGFYIVQGLLVIYLTNFLQYSDTKSYIILGEFSALVYISPILGGFFADHVLGYRYSILIGALLLGSGYTLLATIQHNLLFWGLACIITGNGFLKPNISSYLGEFYLPNDPRRDSGFTIFYMGINLGGLMATISSGFIQEHFGWSIAFTMAVAGMVVAIISFVLGFNRFADYGLPIQREHIKPKFLLYFTNIPIIIALFIASILIAYLLLKFAHMGNILQIAMGIFLLFALLYSATKHDRIARNRMLALIFLITVSIIFWSIFFQAFFSVNLFVERSINRNINGIIIPPVTFLSLEIIFILLLGAPLAHMWQKLNRTKRGPSLGIKFSIAMIALATAMVVLVIATQMPLSGDKISPIWMIFFYLLLTIGEMLLSPIGLSMVTELAPSNLTGLMMGVWFLALGFGGAFAGHLAEKASIPAGITDIHIINTIYRRAFLEYAVLGFLVGIILLIVTPWLKKLSNSYTATL